MVKLEKELEENSQKRAKDFEDLISSLEAKYAPKKKTKLSITDGSGGTRKTRKRFAK